MKSSEPRSPYQMVGTFQQKQASFAIWFVQHGVEMKAREFLNYYITSIQPGTPFIRMHFGV